MAERLSDNLLSGIKEVAALYHRLLLLVAPSGSGKTTALQDLAERTGAPLINVNLEVSKGLLDLSGRQRALKLPQILQDVVSAGADVVLLDNMEVLFDVSLQQDPLRLIQGLSRHRTIVATWNGTVHDGHLRYATPEHLEYRRYPLRDLVIVCPHGRG
jgi:hypothetical protein